MARRQAIDIAIAAAAKPATISLLSVGPLPDGMKALLRIVADGEWRDVSTMHVYQKHTADQVRDASAAFLAAVLFGKSTDPYRVLGLPPNAPAEDVRENKRLLLKWLHPDRNPASRERAHLARVLEAAEAIEEGRTTLAPPQPVRRPGAAPMGPSPRPLRTAHPRPAGLRVMLARGLARLAKGAKVSVLTAGILLVGLIAWRYVMDEPIGVSLARYSQETLGFSTW